MKNATFQTLDKLMAQRILLLDGAMGTMIQRHKLDEDAFRGERFKNHDKELRGNNDLLALTQPELLGTIHRQYLEAGSDIIETNTFSGTTIAQEDYGLESAVFDINVESVRIAKAAALEFSDRNPDKPRFVAGAMGPTNRTLSLSPDVNDPGYRAVLFDAMRDAYADQARALIEGGSDLLLVETITDTLNCKAALSAIERVFEEKQVELPLMISVTIVDKSGRTLSGQTIDAFWRSVRHARPLSVGINCSLGANDMRPYMEELSKIADVRISCYHGPPLCRLQALSSTPVRTSPARRSSCTTRTASTASTSPTRRPSGSSRRAAPRSTRASTSPRSRAPGRPTSGITSSATSTRCVGWPSSRASRPSARTTSASSTSGSWTACRCSTPSMTPSASELENAAQTPCR